MRDVDDLRALLFRATGDLTEAIFSEFQTLGTLATVLLAGISEPPYLVFQDSPKAPLIRLSDAARPEVFSRIKRLLELFLARDTTNTAAADSSILLATRALFDRGIFLRALLAGESMSTTRIFCEKNRKYLQSGNDFSRGRLKRPTLSQGEAIAAIDRAVEASIMDNVRSLSDNFDQSLLGTSSGTDYVAVAPIIEHDASSASPLAFYTPRPAANP